MHRERRDSEQPRQNGVSAEDAGMRANLEIRPKRFKKIPLFIERHAANDVAHCRAEEDREKHAGKGKQEIEERPPERILHVGSKLDAAQRRTSSPKRDTDPVLMLRIRPGWKDQSAATGENPPIILISAFEIADDRVRG